MKRVSVSGRDVAYVDVGAGDGLPLVAVHGFTGHRDDFDGCWDMLAQSRRILVPDLLGHGDTARAEDEAGYTFGAAIELLLGFLDALSIERAHLLGHSMGGMLALRMLLDQPERFESAILMSTAPGCPEALASAGFGNAIDFARSKGMEPLQAAVEKAGRRDQDAILDRWSDRYWSHHARRFRAMDPLAYAGLGEAMRDQESVEARLGEIKCPVAVLVGAFDADFLPGADLFEAGIPGARRWTIPDAGHHPHQENPAAWQTLMQSWLAEQA